MRSATALQIATERVRDIAQTTPIDPVTVQIAAKRAKRTATKQAKRARRRAVEGGAVVRALAAEGQHALGDVAEQMLASRATATSIRSSQSWWSIHSNRSLMSAFSFGSALSVGSALSIGSAGSVLSIGSAGSACSIGSAGSVFSIGSAGGFFSIGASGAADSSDAGPGAAPVIDTASAIDKLSVVLASAALVAAALHRSTAA